MNNHTKHKTPKVGCLYKFRSPEYGLVVKVLAVGKLPNGMPRMCVKVIKTLNRCWKVGEVYGQFDPVTGYSEGGWGFTQNDWKFIGSGVSKYEI